MKCPFCQFKNTKVIDSRVLLEGTNVRRRRMCLQCSRRFTTYEKMEVSMPIIKKNDGRREPYIRQKLLGGIEKATQKRPISTKAIEEMISRIEEDMREKNDKEITTKKVGKIVMQYLRQLDAVAYVRFASVYSNFRDIKDFVKKLQDQEQEDFNEPK